jgi:hypothetical protein
VTWDETLSMTGRMTFSSASTYGDAAAGAGPAYDFIAKPKPATLSSNSTFASAPLSTEPAPTLASAYVPDKPRGFTRPVKGVIGGVLALGFAVLAVAGASAAWSTYQDHRREQLVKDTQVVLPASIVGMTKKGGPVQTQVDKLISQINTPTPAQGAAYVATKSRVALVIAGAYAMSDQDQHDYLAGVTETARSMGITLAAVGPGHLGGHMVCGSRPQSTQTWCAFTDVAAYGVVVVPGSGSSGVSTAGAFRSAVERRS